MRRKSNTRCWITDRKASSRRAGVRTTHTEQPAFLLSLDSDSFSEEYGEVIAGALAWSGNFRLNFEVDESDRLTVLAGANPRRFGVHAPAGRDVPHPGDDLHLLGPGCGRAPRATSTTGPPLRRLPQHPYGADAAEQLGGGLFRFRLQDPGGDDRRCGCDGAGDVCPRRRMVRQQISAQQLRSRAGRLAGQRPQTPRRDRQHRLLCPCPGAEVRDLDRARDGQSEERTGRTPPRLDRPGCPGARRR